MQLNLSHLIAGRRSEYPAAVLGGVVVRASNGQAHSRRWEGIIDTGADFCIIPNTIADDLRLVEIPQRVRVWGYRKEEPPREVDVFYIKLELPSGLELATKAITSARSNILVGRSALVRMRLMIDWPANHWSLEAAALPSRTPGT